MLEQSVSQEQTNHSPSMMVNLIQRVLKLEKQIIELQTKDKQKEREEEEWLRKMNPRIRNRIYSLSRVTEYLCDEFEVTISEIKSSSRKKEIVQARQLAMYMLAEKSTKLSLKSIGIHFGGRDHSTVIHSRQVINNRFDTEPDYKPYYEFLTKKLEKYYIKTQKD